MIDGSDQSRATRKTDAGVSTAALRFFGSIMRHLQALAALAGYEGREATTRVFRVVAFLVLAAVLACFGYVLFLLFLTYLLAVVAGLGWGWATAILAVTHFLVAALCLWNAREGFREPFFPATAAEIRKDLERMRGSESSQPPIVP